MQYSSPVKTIFILRHGKSDWDARYGSDHDRPLAKRGQRAANLVGCFLHRIDQVPQKVISSTALRTRRTAELAMESGRWQCLSEFTSSLYGASVPSVLEILQVQDESLSSVLLVGHQPTCSELIAALTGGISVRFPTAALARIDCDMDRWGDAQASGGTLQWVVTPRLLKQMGNPG